MGDLNINESLGSVIEFPPGSGELQVEPWGIAIEDPVKLALAYEELVDLVLKVTLMLPEEKQWAARELWYEAGKRIRGHLAGTEGGR